MWGLRYAILIGKNKGRTILTVRPFTEISHGSLFISMVPRLLSADFLVLIILTAITP